MQKWFLFCLLISLISTIVIGEENFVKQVNDLKTQVENQELTGLAGALFANDNINIYVNLNNGQQQIVGIVTQDKKVLSMNVGAVEKPTLKVYTDEKTVLEIQNARSSVDILQAALREKKITYEAVGFFNKIKFAFISAFARMSSKELKEEKLTEKEKKEDLKEVEKEAKKEEKKEEPKVVVGETKDNVEVVGEVKSEAKEETKKLEVVKENGTEVNVEIPVETKIEGVVHTVLIKKDGFEPSTITIKKGETIEWKNERDSKARLNKAMIVGAQLCSKIKSKIFNSGESFKWTFENRQTCTFIEGIDTMKLMTVIVE
ncbi:hypothetical protein HYX11_00375 [Candidatus Woesearchaeota archaeon]|nr:hypothetical protein [Candidatus Woesearchaeota archaeon]